MYKYFKRINLNVNIGKVQNSIVQFHLALAKPSKDLLVNQGGW